MPKTCPECHGSGLDRDRKACGRCGGLGDVYELRPPRPAPAAQN